MSTIGTTLFSKIEINGQEVDIATLDANDGIYALPAGQTTANVKFTMIDNTSIPRGVFEENSYITAMTLPDAMTYIASYSFHGVNNINISDKNAILAINPYAFDAEPTPPGPEPKTDPDIYFDNSELTVDYQIEPDKLNGNSRTQALKGDNRNDSAWINWSTSDSSIATVQGNGYVIAHGNGTVNVIVNYAAHDNYNSKTVQYQLTITNYNVKQNPTGQWYNNGNPINYIDVVQGGSSTYTLTFSGTPSDSWTFSIDSGSTINGVSVDSTGTITINESQLNTLGSFAITANRPVDTSYYEGVAQISISISRAGDPDFYFYSNNYEITSGMGMSMSMNLYNNTGIDQMTYPIQWTSSSADITVDQSGYVNSSMVGATGTITATISDGTNTHTATCTVNIVAGKQTPTGGWYENSSQVLNLELVEGSIDAHDLTFEATPNDSWTFSYMSLPTGITLDSSTGEITVQSGALATAGEYYINANRMEDASYYPGMTSLTIKVFPSGTDLNFHYDQLSVNLDNQAMTSSTPILTNYTSIDTTLHPIQYVSGDTNVATVDNNGTISFVGGGTTTVTATLSDGNETHTATITVYCNVMKQTPYATWIDPSTQMSSTDITCTGGTTIQFGGTPLSGWTFSTTDPDLVIDQSTGQITVPTGDLSGTQYTVNASYTEDATYYSGSETLTITIS